MSIISLEQAVAQLEAAGVDMTPRCDTCGTTENIIGVHSSSLGPISICSCKTCMEQRAEPSYIVDNLMKNITPDVLREDVADGVKTFTNGGYLTIREYHAQCPKGA
jgi:hypothetical protein